MIDAKITDILNSQDLFKLSDKIEDFFPLIEVEQDKNAILRAFFDRLVANCFEMDFYNNMPHKVFSGSSGINLYLKDNWYFSNSYRVNIKRLQTIVCDIRKKMIKPQGSRILSDDITLIMGIVDDNLNFSAKILKNACFEVILLNHSHIEWNSFLSTRILPNKKQGFRIMATHVRGKDASAPQYVFLHELGHILYKRLTGSLNIPPNGFLELQQTMFSGGGQLSKENLSELFADCFAIAAAFNTPLELYDPFHPVTRKDKAIITAYIKLLIESLNDIKAK